jgi:hypothetical protein
LEETLKAAKALLLTLDLVALTAVVRAAVVHALVDAPSAAVFMADMVARPSAGRHLLAAHAHALVLSGDHHLKVRLNISKTKRNESEMRRIVVVLCVRKDETK